MRRLLFGFLSVFSLFWPTAGQAADPVSVALEAEDPMAVEDLLRNPRGLNAVQVMLLNGAAAAMRFDDKVAVEALTRALASSDIPPTVRRQALMLLAGVHLRANNYAASAEAFDAGLAIPQESEDADGLHATRQARDVAHALKAEAPQTHEPIKAGSVPIVRDAANLARSVGQVNGQSEEFILDTGAGYSTITRSAAQRFKVRVLPQQITVGSATAKSVPAQLGIADTVEIAGNTFHNVVFLVMADEALSFAGGAYKIDAILGFPVLARLGRIEFVRDGAAESFRVGASSTPGVVVRDLYLDVLRPMVIVELGGIGRVRMLLDTGARRTSLNGAFAKAYPAALENAPSEKQTFGGAGAMQTKEVRVLRNVTILADGRARRVDAVSVSDEKRNEHGMLGQDVMRADGGFALDFNTMDFVFLPGR